MKAPVDPSEPMFPIRPSEPMCQYYMKHGTCKFGQACKFHHPPQSSVTAALVGGGTVVMNVGRKTDVPQIVVNSLAGEATASGTPMMLQFLPQRPEEQDCIFFLKNGRCKYGATCRYHHPINFNQRRDDGRRQRVHAQQVPDSFLRHSNVQFISQAGSHHMNYQQGPTTASNGSHMVVAEGPVTYRTVDGSSGKGSYHTVSVVSGDGFGAPISHNQDHTSSTSSLASSYDTANSNVDHLVPHTEQSSGLWNRQKNNGSHASLNAYDATGRQQIGARMAMPQSTSDGSIASRRRRAASYGSASDSGVFVDANGSLARATSGGALPSNNSSNSMPGWRNERTPSFDNIRRGGATQYRVRGDIPSGSHHEEGRDPHPAQVSPSAATATTSHGRRVPGGRRRSCQAVDDGLSMMTSALLTMLDTPEEAAAEGYDYEKESLDEQDAAGQLPPSGTFMPSVRQGMSAPGTNDMTVAPSRMPADGQAYYGNGRQDTTFLSGLAMNSPVAESQYQETHTLNPENPSWLPHWQGSNSVGRPFGGEAQSTSVMRSPHPGPSSPENQVGLFLP